MDQGELTDSEQPRDNQERSRADMVSSFILHAPPGELHEVLEDVKGIVRDDRLIEEQVHKVLPRYTKIQLTPVKLTPNSEHAVVLSNFNDIGGNRFADPRTKTSFLYNHVSGTVSDLQPWEPDSLAESWRAALEQQWTEYSTQSLSCSPSAYSTRFST